MHSPGPGEPARVFLEVDMPGGRRPKGPELVDGLKGSVEAKARLRVVLETITQEKTIAEACTELGLEESMVHLLRQRALSAGLAELEAKPRGRRSKGEHVESEVLAELERENEELKAKLRAAELRAELAVAIPGLAGRVKEPEKKTEAQREKR
jgi:transposase-like protein